MQVKNIQISSGSYKNSSQKTGKAQEGFSQILDGIIDLQEGESPQIQDEELGPEEDEESTLDETINFIFNMSLMNNREVRLSIATDETLEGIGDSRIVFMDKGEIFNQKESLFIEEDQISPEAFEDNMIMAAGDLNLNEDIVSSQELDVDFDLILDTKEEAPVSRTIDIVDRALKEKAVDNTDGAILDRDMESVNGEEIASKDNVENMDLDRKSSLAKKRFETGDREVTAMELKRGQPKFIESKEDINMQDNILSRENLDAINNSIIQLMETTTEEGTSTMKVKLYPEELGSVDITLTMEEGKLIAKILVDSAHVKQLFASSIEELNQNLSRQDIHIGDVQVDLNNNSGGNQSQDDRNYFTPRRNIGFSSKGLDNSSIEERIYETGAVSILA